MAPGAGLPPAFRPLRASCCQARGCAVPGASRIPAAGPPGHAETGRATGTDASPAVTRHPPFTGRRCVRSCCGMPSSLVAPTLGSKRRTREFLKGPEHGDVGSMPHPLPTLAGPGRRAPTVALPAPCARHHVGASPRRGGRFPRLGHSAGDGWVLMFVTFSPSAHDVCSVTPSLTFSPER